MPLDTRHIQGGRRIPVVATTADGYPVEAEVTNNVNTTVTNIVQTVPSDSAALDAFSRTRVSEPIGRFDAQLTYNLQPLLFEQVVSGAGATISHETTNRAAFIAFSNTPNAGTAYMQSYRWSYYHPGNSQLIFVTFNFGGHEQNVTKLAGYGDLTNNGIHFISTGTAYAWRILSNTDNGDETVTQANWNIDKMDGTGASGIILDGTKTQIAVIDLQALYVGRVRVGFNIDGVIVYCHEFLHANRSIFPYIQTATLPVICGMVSQADNTDGTMLFFCATVRSEGADPEEEGFGFSIEGTATAGNNTRAHILSVRPNTTFNSLPNRINFVLENIEVLVTGNTPVLWEICLGQAISGTTAFIDVNATYSGFEYNTLGTISGNPAIVVAQGYCAATAANKTSISHDIVNRYPITLDAAGAVRALGTLSVLVTGLGATSTTRTSLNWREIR